MTDRVGCEHLEGRVLLAADPITSDNPLWVVPRGAAVIDGLLDEAGWESAFSTTRSLAYRAEVVATIYAMHDSTGIYLAADVRDQHLWADGNGAGAGNQWDIENDDSLTFYFDVNNSRDEYLQLTDFAFGYSIGSFTDPKNDASGPVRRFKFINGDGAGGGGNAGWYGDDWNAIVEGGGNPEDYYLPPGASYMTVADGTVNDNSDLDAGWTSELFLPWSALGIAAPTHGTTIGMNFDVILDDSGGTRDLLNTRHTAERWDNPYTLPDDHMVGVHSSYNATQPGLHGPVNSAHMMFIDASAGEAPAPIDDLAAANVTGYSARLAFTSPAGTSTGLGHLSAYQIRYSTSPIATERDWFSATALDNRYLPRLAGKAESLRLIGLAPATTYWAAIRAVDGAGNVGEMATTTFTTQTTAQDTSAGLRLVPSPLGRLMVTEAGDPFFAVGDHLGLSWAYTRQLFPGDVWDSGSGVYQNFHDNLPVEGHYSAYFDLLQARGVNTMRVFIEQPGTNAEGNPGLPDDPRGTYWLESDVGVYNPDMRAFLDTLLAEADARGMYLIISPFSTYYYRDAFGNEGPWATNFGGPLTDIDDFFQSPETLTIAKNRVAEVVGWVRESPYAARVMGYEIINEWNTGWTRNAEGDGSADRAVEMTRRAAWVGELARYTRALDPERLILNCPVVEDARGAIARSVFYSRDFDVLAPHFYSLGVQDGIRNPSGDRAVSATIEQARLTAYWLHLADDRRPLLNGEWGPVRATWPTGSTYYSDQTYKWGSYGDVNGTYTLAEDETLFSAVLWSSIASGQFGTPLRMGADLLNFITGVNESGRTLTQGFLLSDNMRLTQQLISTWWTGSDIGFDPGTYSPDPLTGRLSASSASGFTLHAFGGSDGSQGVVYILQDRDAMDGTVTDGKVRITGLESDSLFDIEIWLTALGTTGPARVIENIFSADGSLQINLPAFTQGTVLRFKAHRPVGQIEEVVALRAGNGRTVTFTRGLDLQPVATIFDSATGTATTVDISALTNFRGRVVDMTPYRTPNGRVHLAVTDDRHHLWVFHGDLGAGTWSVEDLTAKVDAPGMTGDLTVYQPKWNAIHIGGLDVRGHAVNYWWAPGMDDFAYADLTALLNGPTMRGGLAGFVSSWGALNLAGLNDAGQVVVYWWAPGMKSWATVNMTTRFNGPTLSGQLTAFVTPWGGLNIAGLNDQGACVAYWWVPKAKSWMVANLTTVTGAEPFAQGVTGAMSTDGGINLFGLSDQDHVVMLRFSLKTNRWSASDVTAAAGASGVSFPLGAASAGSHMTLGAATLAGGSELLLHIMDLTDDTWTWTLATDGPIA